MDPVDLKNLSSLSKRVNMFIKSSIPKNRYKLKIYFDLFPRVDLVHGDSITTFNMKTVNVYSEHPDENGRYIYTPFPQTFLDEMTAKADFISTTFNCKFNYLSMEPEHYDDQIRTIVDWISTRQSSIDGLKLLGTRIKDDEVLYLIKNCKITRDFCLVMDPRYHSISPLHHRFTTDFVSFSEPKSVPWISLDDVSTFDCIFIELGGGRSYSIHELNRFLKSWIDGSNERMEYFSIFVPHFNHEILTDGIEVEERDKSVVRSYTRYPFYRGHRQEIGEQEEIRGGFDIKSKNGTKLATIQQEPQQHVFEDGTVYTRDLCHFEMIVWK